MVAVPLQLGLDALDRLLGPLARRDEMRLRVNRQLVVLPERLPRERVERGQLVDLVSEQLDAHRDVLIRRVHLDDIASNPEHTAREVVVVPLVLDFDQLAEDLIAIDPLPALERQHHPVVRLGRPQAVDT